MLRNLRYVISGSFVLMLCLAGCGGNGPIDISGTVTFSGQPLEKGNIAFLPSKGDGPTAATIITNGKYAVRVALGSKRVKIEGFRILGKKQLYRGSPDSPMIDDLKQILPDKYNSKSTLTSEITSGKSDYDFSLEK